MGNVIGQVSDPGMDIAQRYEEAQKDESLSGLWWLTNTETTDLVQDMQIPTNKPAGITQSEYNDFLSNAAVESTYLEDISASKNGVDAFNGLPMDGVSILKALRQGDSMKNFIVQNLADS